MFIDEGQQALVSYGGRKTVFIPGPGVAPAPVLAAVALSTKPAGTAAYLGPGLAAGTYGYLFSWQCEDWEYPVSAEAQVTWNGPGLGEVRVTIPVLAPGATDINLYGRAVGAEVMLQRHLVAGVQGQVLAPLTFVDQGQAVDGQLQVAANTYYKRGGGRVHRLHVPGGGGALGNVTIADAANGDGSGGRGNIYGPTMAVVSSITDIQVVCPNGVLVTRAAATNLVLGAS